MTIHNAIICLIYRQFTGSFVGCYDYKLILKKNFFLHTFYTITYINDLLNYHLPLLKVIKINQ